MYHSNKQHGGWRGLRFDYGTSVAHNIHEKMIMPTNDVLTCKHIRISMENTFAVKLLQLLTNFINRWKEVISQTS